MSLEFASPTTGSAAPTPAARLLRVLGGGRRLFRAFRQTRPFWGGLLLILAGAWIIKLMSFSFGFVLAGGWNASAGYVLGGALVVFGLTVWAAPHYAPLLGIFAVIVALAAFVSANLGGYLIGSLLGILGGSMVWGWGEKGEKGPRRARRPERRRDDGPVA